MIHASHKLWFEDDYCRTYRQSKTWEHFNQGSSSTLITEQIPKPEPMIRQASEENEQRQCSDERPYFPKSEVFVAADELCVSVSVPPVMVLPDERWQARLGNISRRFLAINFRWRAGGWGGACAALSIFVIWFVICSDSCYGNHCGNHGAGRDPHCKSFNDRFGILIIDGQTSAKVHLCGAAALGTIPAEWLHHSSAYQSAPPQLH